MDDPLLEALTPAQREAVQHVDGPLLILAGPGSGKTRVVTRRVAYLLAQGIPAPRILALTFTNKAADEMRGRVERLAPGQRAWMGTFHRFCARLLRQYAPLAGLEENYTIYDTADSLGVVRRAIDALGFDPNYFTPQQVAAAISWAKNNLIPHDQYQPRRGQPLGHIVAQVYPLYQKRLLQSNAVDFDDLLLHVAMLLRHNPELRQTLDLRYRYILVDEYQDTNLAQYTIVRAMSIDYPNLAVTGDPDQSIYGWRGASLSNILDFEHDFPDVHVVRLEQNYRSTRRIVRVAAALIAHNVLRKEKDLFTENDEGPPVRLVVHAGQREEAEAIAERIAAEVRSGRRRSRDFAIFYRVNALSRELEHALREQGVPYQIVQGVEFYQRREIRDVLGYLALLNNPRDDVAFRRVVNTPARGIGKSTLDRLAAHAVAHGQTLLSAAREAGLVAGLPKRAAVAVARFVALVDRLQLVAARPVEEIVGHVLEATDYRGPFMHSQSPDDQERLANIEELLTAARQFDERTPGEGRLEEFLEETCLVNDTDDWEAASDRVTLMTMHAAKGLEFPVVFIIAFEQGLIPHERSQAEPSQVEEERRLLFVGITRAREELQISQARYRDFRGQRKMAVPSEFLRDLPLEELDRDEGPSPPTASDAPNADDFDPRADDEPVWTPPGEEAESVRDVRREGPNPAPAGTRAARLTTAAELAAGRIGDAAVAHDVFKQGMLVRHPEYGLGKVVALAGSGTRRTATVNFVSGAGQRKFVIRQSQLKDEG
ncbi:MAG TPA: UvrD-helicase domain-containing protein [Pirellulales bacterium]|nr:UvrD-helicase domain-containing protein [Pirellulales bacterium]